MKDRKDSVKQSAPVALAKASLNDRPLYELLRERARASSALAMIDAAIANAHLRDADDVETFSSLNLAPEIRHLKNARRVHAEMCRRIPTATKDGHVWTVPRADWYAARRGVGRPSNASRVKVAPVPSSEIDLIDRALADAGIRATRRSA